MNDFIRLVWTALNVGYFTINYQLVRFQPSLKVRTGQDVDDQCKFGKPQGQRKIDFTIGRQKEGNLNNTILKDLESA